MIVGVFGTFIAILSFAVLLEIPKRYLVPTALVGAVGGFVYLFGIKMELDVVMSSFLSALCVAFLSHIFARIYKAPVTLFLIAGILPTVPGGGMYQIVTHIINGSPPKSMLYLVQTLEIAGVIALAIFVVDSIFRVKKNRSKANVQK